jgi:NAD(P)-dependent dehydrogenase (short-subunit alcohol dehydrogenase family)
MGLDKSRIVIIGGTSGIGLAVAQGAMAQGAKVVVGSSTPQKVQASAQSLPGAESYEIDVKNHDSVKAFFARTGEFDHLVYTAGDWNGPRRVPLNDVDLDAAATIFGVRFWGALAAVKFGHKNIRKGGSITLTDGMIAQRPQPGSAISTAMAGAVEHLIRGLAVELAPLRVNGVCPGAINTDIWNAIPADQRGARIEAMTKRLPVPRIGEPEEAAEAYLYLMRAGYTTGQVLYVDGGQSVV